MTLTSKAAPNIVMSHLKSENVDITKRMFGVQWDTDFVIKTTEDNNVSTIIKVHKDVLTANSLYFNGMFAANMKEANENVMMVPENSKIMNELLRFIYTGDIKFTHANAIELAFAAEKYQLEGMKQKCFNHIIGFLTTANVLQTLIDVDCITGAETVKNKCIQLIIRYEVIY